MSDGESMFKYHGYSGPCPKPPLPKPSKGVATKELIERLRHTASKGVSVWGDLQIEAAKEIEILAAEVELYASAMDRMKLAIAQQVAVPQEVRYVPVSSKLRDANWNHPNDNEPRSEACRAALQERGDDEGQGLDGYWKWGFVAGFNAALAAAPHPPQAERVPMTEAEATKILHANGYLYGPSSMAIIRFTEAHHGIGAKP